MFLEHQLTKSINTNIIEWDWVNGMALILINFFATCHGFDMSFLSSWNKNTYNEKEEEEVMVVFFNLYLKN